VKGRFKLFMSMVKDTKQTVRNVDYFIKNNNVQKVNSYDNYHRKSFYFIVDGIVIRRKDIGDAIFIYCEKNDLHKKKWATMIKDYQKQIESLL